jgi:hypothetical protein
LGQNIPGRQERKNSNPCEYVLKQSQIATIMTSEFLLLEATYLVPANLGVALVLGEGLKNKIQVGALTLL